MELNDDSSESILTMLLWAVASLLSTRLFLELTGYPQVGGGDWHVAHALFGGVLMTIGMMMVLSFKGEEVRKWAGAIFGIGLGWFVDEMGKFISSDNNYFFQPAISLAYGFFVLIFLFYRFIEKRDKVTSYKKSRWSKWFSWLKSTTYHKLFKRKLTFYLLIMISLLYAITGTWDLINLGFKNGWLAGFRLASDLITAGMFLMAIFLVLRKKRRLGIKYFQYGLLVNIFLGQVFKFYYQQLSAVFGLFFSIAVYYGLERLRREKII